MKTLKQIMSESDYTDPKSPGDKAFVDKHVIQKTDYPHKPKDGSNDDIFSGKKQKKKKKLADYEKGQDKEVYEDKMSKGDMKRKEQIVKGMKKNTADFISRYGKDAESVMHATATKQAQSEESDPWAVDATEEEIEALKEVHDTLNDANKEEFLERMKTREGLQALITFATNLQGE